MGKKIDREPVDFSSDKPQTLTILPRAAVSAIFRALNDPECQEMPLCEQAYRIAKDLGIKTKYV